MNRIEFSERNRSDISLPDQSTISVLAIRQKPIYAPSHALINPSSILTDNALLFSLECIGETTHVVLEVALVAQELHVGTVVLESSLTTLRDVVLPGKRCETPVLGRNDLLASWELVLGATEGLDGGGSVLVTGADTEDDLANVDTGDETVGLSESTTHTGLESIGSGTRQHFVDSDDVVWVSADTHVETFLSGDLDKVPVGSIVSSLTIAIVSDFDILVGANTGSF